MIAPAVIAPQRRGIILGTCCLSLFIVGTDVSAVNVALPSIGASLGATSSQLQWVIDAYALVIASLLTLGGSLGDRLGRKRVFQTGLAVFAAASILCSLATTPGLLIGARALQGVGGAMLNPVAMSIIVNVFVEPRDRARAIGTWAAAIGVSMASGPVIGGVLVSGIGWEAIFWLNVPICLLAVFLTQRFVPESRAERARRPDPLGQVLVLVFLSTLTFAIIEGRGLGWSSSVVRGCFATAAVAVTALVVYELRRRDPLIDPRFFRSAPFSAAVGSAVVLFAATGGFLFLNTLYLQQVRGMTPVEAGLMTLPMAVASAVAGPAAGRLVAAAGTRLPMALGGIAVAISGALLMAVGNHTSLWYIGVAYLAFGLGSGLINPPITNAAVSGMPRSQSGVAASMVSTGRQVGMALGVAVYGTIAFSGTSGHVAAGFAVAARPAWLITAVAGVVVVALALVSTSTWGVRSAERTAELVGSA